MSSQNRPASDTRMKEKFTDVLHTTISPCDNERRIFNEAFTAISRGYRTEIIALKTPDVPRESSLKDLVIRRLSIKNWQSGPRKFLSFNWKLFRYLMKQETHIIHAHDLWVLPGSAAASLLKGIKLIYDAHEFTPGLEIFNTQLWSGRIWMIAERMLIRRVNFLIAINRFHQKLFMERYPDIPGSGVIMNLPSISHAPSEAEIPDFDGRRQSVIYQGILKEGRGLRTIIRAMHDVTAGHLDLAGYGEIETELHKIVSGEDLEDKVTFRGKVPWETVLDETKQARAGLVLFEAASVNYTFASPNKFFEYVMAGTPVIASDIPTFREFVSRFEVGVLVQPDDPASISRAIQMMLSDREAWQKYHRNCLKAREVWNWEYQEEDLIEIYRKLSPG